MKRPIFFVDGFNMYHALDEAPAFHKYKWLDLTDPERPCRCVSTLPHNAPREAGTSLVMLSSVKALSLPLYDIGKVRPHTAQANKPFCAFLSWNPPHPPYDQVPQPYLERYAGELRFRQNVPEAMRRDESYRKKMREYYAVDRKSVV